MIYLVLRCKSCLIPLDNIINVEYDFSQLDIVISQHKYADKFITVYSTTNTQ